MSDVVVISSVAAAAAGDDDDDDVGGDDVCVSSRTVTAAVLESLTNASTSLSKNKLFSSRRGGRCVYTAVWVGRGGAASSHPAVLSAGHRYDLIPPH